MRAVRKTWLVPAVIVVLTAFPFRVAHACGAAIHRMVASMAISKVKNRELKELLSTTGGAGDYKRWYLSGAVFPDVWKFRGDKFHWHDFLNKYAAVIVEECRENRGKVCKQRIAHFLGVVVHQRSDNRFDKYFVAQVKKACPKASAHWWADNIVDQIAICDYGTGIAGGRFVSQYGLTFVQDVEVPEVLLTVVQRIDEVFMLADTAAAFRNTLSDKVKAQQALLAKESKLRGFPEPIACRAYVLASDKRTDDCPWGGLPENYMKGSGTTGSISDIGEDVLPDWLDTIYDALMKAIKDQNVRAPTFSSKGSGDVRELCRNWIPESKKYCQ